MKTVIRLCSCIYTLLLVVSALSSTAHAIEKPNVDLYKGTLNGRVFYNLTIDDITDLFGRPSHQIEDNSENLLYSDLGLLFSFDPSSEKCRLMAIDIVGNTIGKTGEKTFDVKKYSGVISKNMDGNWKLKRVMAEFKDNKPEAGVRAEYKVVGVQFSNHSVTFAFNQGTEFLDLIIINNINVKQDDARQAPDKARYQSALAQMRILEDALIRYKLDNGVFPTTKQGLEALVRKPSVGVIPRHWPEGGYLDEQEVPKDPWGNAYIYISPGQHSPDYDLKSLGADGREGGEGYNADIESWRIGR